MLPKNLYTIITKQPNQIIPVDYLKHILSKKPNVFGYAVQDGEGLSVGREEGPPDFDALDQMNGETQGMRSMLCFGWLDKGYNVEDIQPFTINDADDNPFLAIGLDGDFPTYDTNNGRTQEFNLMSEIIAPSLADICELTDGEIGKLMAALGKPVFENNFTKAIGHRGVLSILPFDGDEYYLGTDVLGGDPFTWGRTSNLHEWGKEKVQEPVVEKKARFTFGGKKVTPPALPQDVATKGEGPKTSVPEVKKVGNTTVVDTKKEEPKATGPAPVRPPDWCHKNDDKRSWYQMVAGSLPSGWKKNIPVIPAEGVKLPGKIEDLTEWRANRAKSTISNQPKPVQTQTSAGPVKTAEQVKAVKAEENSPIIRPEKMEKILDIAAKIEKHVDGQSVEMNDPKTIQAVESKFTDFSNAVASKPSETVNWPVSSLFAIGNTDVAALVCYAVEMRALARMYMEEKGMMVKPEPAKTTTTVTKIGDNSTKTESISNETAPAPKKKGFSFGKKAAA